MQKTLLAIALALLFSFTQTTPAQALTYSPGSITEDTTWTKAEGPYLVDTLYIPAGVTLTIEPGTIIKLNQPGCNCYENIWVAGRIVAGALNSIDRVLFTSVNDDSGGDTNNDGTTTIPTSGDWRQIYIAQGGTLELYNTDVRYGGVGNAPHIYLNPDNIRQINNAGGTVIMDGVDIGYGYIANYRQWYGEGTTTIRNSFIHDSGNGLTFTGGNATVEGNTFARTGSAIEYPWSMPLVHHDNHGTGFITRSGLFESDATLTPDTLPYTLGWLNIPQGVTLTILPGSILKGLASLYVYGTLVVGTATATDPVVITSYADDTVLGDTNGDGAATTPQPGDWGTVTVTGNGRAHIAHTTFRYGGAYTCDYWGKVCTIPMLQNAGGTLTLSHTIATDAKEHILLSLGGTTTVTTSEFARGTYGVSVQRGTTTIHSSRIHDNSTYGVFNAPANQTMVDATNNWWGSPTGPTHPSNPGGTGDRVSEGITFTSWLTQEPSMTNEPTTCVVDCNSNVLFLPGMMGSRLFEQSGVCLYATQEQERWVSIFDCNQERLALNEHGKSINPLYTKEGESGVIDDAYSANMYQSFMHDLDVWKNDDHLINDYALIAYDWRLSLEDILQNGATTTDGTLSYATSQGFQHSYIYQTLKQLAQSSRTGKVTIVAHSNGGLVTKALIKKLKETNDPLYDQVDNIIFVAVPQTGTPEAVSNILHGDQIGPWGAVMGAKRLRDLTQNMPGAHHLLPSNAYFSVVGTPPVTFTAGTATQPFINAYGHSITNTADLDRFLLGADGRPQPTYADLDNPTVLHPNLLTYAQDVHQQLDDNWEPSAGTKIYQIAGWGESTLANMNYRSVPNCDRVDSVVIWGRENYYCGLWGSKLTFDPNEVIDGDGTVLTPSALAMSTSSEQIKRFWVDLETYNKPVLGINREHKDILEVPQLREFIYSIVAQSSSTPTVIIATSTPSSTNTACLIFTLHSPLTLEFTDERGRHIGPSTTTPETIDFNVPGARYNRYGDVQLLSIPKTATGTLALRGLASGSFTLDIKEQDGNTTIATTSFEGIVSATSTLAIMSITPTQSTTASSTLVVDVDGNGTTDITLQAKENAVVLLPPPYFFGGFLQPINDIAYHPEQSPSVFKGGSTIPVKFQLKSATGTPVQAKTLPIFLTPQRLSAMSVSIDEPIYSAPATSGTTFKWDSTSQQYIYNWSTKGLTTGYWYKISTKLEDDTVQSVVVGIR